MCARTVDNRLFGTRTVMTHPEEGVAVVFTCIDTSVLGVLRHPADDQASSLNALLVEVLDELVALAVDAGRPQGARVQTLSTLHLEGGRESGPREGKYLPRGGRGQISVDLYPPTHTHTSQLHPGGMTQHFVACSVI